MLPQGRRRSTQACPARASSKGKRVHVLWPKRESCPRPPGRLLLAMPKVVRVKSASLWPTLTHARVQLAFLPTCREAWLGPEPPGRRAQGCRSPQAPRLRCLLLPWPRVRSLGAHPGLRSVFLGRPLPPRAGPQAEPRGDLLWGDRAAGPGPASLSSTGTLGLCCSRTASPRLGRGRRRDSQISCWWGAPAQPEGAP